jgi:hypothetical protein
MKTSLRPLVITGLTACAALWAMPGTAHAQIYVTGGAYVSGAIGEYNLDGTPVNSSLVSGLNFPIGIAVSGGDLFVASSGTGGNGTIGEYNLDGTPINASLVSGLNSLYGIAVVPEPTTLALTGFGGLSLLWFHRRWK